MSRKKSTYAEKHNGFMPNASSSFSAFVSDNQDLFEVMRAPYEFFDKFPEMPYPRQIAMIDMFRNIINGNIIISPRKIKRTLQELAHDELEQIHWMTGSSDEGDTYFPIADDEKKLVRMECYGTIDARREHELSPYYKYFIKPENCGKYHLKDYDMQNSPMWRVFNQFESFRTIAPTVRRYLYNKGVNPDALKVMSVSDFCDVIHKIYAKSPDSMKARFLPLGYKNRFVMSFMRHCGKTFEKQLLNKGLDNRKVQSLSRMMRWYGICDVDRVVVTETHYTKRILDDLQDHHYDISNIKIGDPISEKMLNDVFENQQESLLLARDEKGLPLDKSDMPRFEVHHKNAVKFAKCDDYLAKVNYNNNLMLVEKEIHRAYYHGFDHIIQVNQNNERYFSRINSINPELCMVNGFSFGTDMIAYDLENNASAQRRSQNDKKNVVNYYEMYLRRLNNIPEIADKYAIEYSKTDLSNEYKNLMELTQFKLNIPSEDAKILKDLFSSNLKEKKKKGRKNAIPIKKTGNER